MPELATLPADILLSIFDWVSRDEIDFALLAVSKHTRSVLLNHPVVQALGPLGIIRLPSGQLGLAVVNEILKFEPNTDIKPFCITPSLSVDEVTKKPWCTANFAQRVQYALIRTMIKIHWGPILVRDGRLQTPESLTTMLDRVMARCITNENTFGGTVAMTDTSEGDSLSLCECSLSSGFVAIKDSVTRTKKVVVVPVKMYIDRQYRQAILSFGRPA